MEGWKEPGASACGSLQKGLLCVSAPLRESPCCRPARCRNCADLLPAYGWGLHPRFGLDYVLSVHATHRSAEDLIMTHDPGCAADGDPGLDYCCPVGAKDTAGRARPRYPAGNESRRMAAFPVSASAMFCRYTMRAARPRNRFGIHDPGCAADGDPGLRCLTALR